MSLAGSGVETEHSRAFETLVERPDDIIGLFAYALYKQSIHERRANGMPAPVPKDRNPQAFEIAAWRNLGESFLETYARAAINAERANILRDGIEAVVGELRSDLKAHVDGAALATRTIVRQATGFWWPGVVCGIVAWLISIAITILVAYSVPDWVKALVAHVTSR